ncbi:hypothetical protein GSI_15638 [Ganoderma sinense ZZ0214-1]|uniref:Uncharacterized protein n=1 Tax=Ganoderma sinense ZZ0214-1 TaxID=1077348 RepID=A0A2G8RN49_9APHY|nr:hypothetical protein GSI_15638 [Ganoderma sinense ZZ0214-1]
MRTAIFALVSLVASAAAQSVVIAAPAPSTTLSLGESFVVDVDRPASLTGSQEVAVAIGLRTCLGSCTGLNATSDIGTSLFAGPYAPAAVGGGSLDVAQNFTVQVPVLFLTGPALLSVAHFALIEGTEPFLEVVSETVNIAL